MTTLKGEVLFEFVQVGNHLKVSAVDVDTNIEVSMVASPRMDRGELKQAILRKLRYVINKSEMIEKDGTPTS